MEDRYVGDIGDFSKLGLLRCLQKNGLSIGVNWYHVPNEKQGNNGKKVDYLQEQAYGQYDILLWETLKEIVESGYRSISALEKSGLLFATYYHEPLDFSSMKTEERRIYRQEWHSKALNALSDAGLVFLDPDVGLLVRSKKGTKEENKYIELQEIADYYAQGSSVVYFQEQGQRQSELYRLGQYKALLESGLFPGAAGLGVKFNTTSLRYYFFILRPEHEALISAQVQKMLAGPWRRHFGLIELN